VKGSPKNRNDPESLPYVLINMAMSADGKIATANRAIASFGSRKDQEHLYALRATVDAVMSGARTVRAENVDLDPGPRRFRRLRRQRGLAAYNLRIVVTRSGQLPPTARIFAARSSPLIILTCQQAGSAALHRLQQLADHVGVFGKETVDLRTALHWLRHRWNVRRLLCEGGGELNQALCAANLVHELHLTLCPKIFGGATAPTLADGQVLGRIADAPRCQLRSRRRVGDELFLTYDVLPPISSALRASSQRRSLSRFR
jgi:riboflavin-specific deaminase-like protein